MSISLQGSLEDFGIAEVFQLIGQQRKTGTLDVSNGDQTLRIAFYAGCVVWGRPVGDDEGLIDERLARCGFVSEQRLEELRAQSEASARPVSTLAIAAGDVTAEDIAQLEETLTNETLFILLRWSCGSFDFSAQAVAHDRPPEKVLAAEQILMDGLRMVDEWQTFAALVPDGDTVFGRSGSLDLQQKSLGGQGRQRLSFVERVYNLVDGRRPAQRIIDLSRLGLFDATRALAELHRNELIAPVAKRRIPLQRHVSQASPRSPADRARGWLAVAFPLALLSGMVFWIATLEPVEASPGVFPIVRAPLAEAREGFEKRRLRNRLEAGHLISGGWPEALSPREPAGGGASGALTGARGDAYYYARRGNGVVLLAPGR